MKQVAVWAKLFAATILLQGFIILITVFDKLGLEEAEAKKFVVSNVLGNFHNIPDNSFVPNEFRVPRARALSAIVSGDKVGAARELCSWLKAYTNSEEFRQAYSQRREALKPTSTGSVRPDDETIEMTRESLKSTEKDLAAMKKMKEVPPATIKALEEQVKQQSEMLKVWSDPNPALTRWQDMYPSDPQELVRQRLRSYLQLVATVDFDAELTAPDKYSIQKFVKPEYEKKNNQWKAVYRAGRDVNVAVTSFVNEWLKEISPKAAQTSGGKGTSPAATKASVTKKPAVGKQ